MVPTRIIFSGHRDSSVKLLGLARQQMAKLERAMEFQNLRISTSVLEPYDGASIKCTSTFSLRVILIHTPGGGGEFKQKKCWCSPCLVTAVILKVSPEDMSENDLIDGLAYKYDVEACVGDKYIRLLNQVRSHGYERYNIKQQVLLSISMDDEDDLDCCVNTRCLANDLTNAEKLDPFKLIVVPVATPTLAKYYGRN